MYAIRNSEKVRDTERGNLGVLAAKFIRRNHHLFERKYNVGRDVASVCSGERGLFDKEGCQMSLFFSFLIALIADGPCSLGARNEMRSTRYQLEGSEGLF